MALMPTYQMSIEQVLIEKMTKEQMPRDQMSFPQMLVFAGLTDVKTKGRLFKSGHLSNFFVKYEVKASL
jgi:hypothetical protein